MGEIKSFDLWMEGYICTGQSSGAEFLGTFTASSFIEACDKWAETLGDEKEYYSKKGDKAWFWGCRIYDNEADARKSFG